MIMIYDDSDDDDDDGGDGAIIDNVNDTKNIMIITRKKETGTMIPSMMIMIWERAFNNDNMK